MINDKFISQLKSQVNRMPNKPGVYIMSNDQGKVIYVGKAKGLKNRVRSYFTPKPANDKVEAILKEIKTIDITVTITENQLLKSSSEDILMSFQIRKLIALKIK